MCGVWPHIVSISIHAPREGRDERGTVPRVCADISIHAPREGRDRRARPRPRPLRDFNPRAPRGARRRRFGSSLSRASNFNPRAPRGARHHRRNRLHWHPRNFNPRAPRGARPLNIVKAFNDDLFQSTRPARGATPIVGFAGGKSVISIHAPREGRDWSGRSAATNGHNFNPRAPRGARQLMNIKAIKAEDFNPRAPRGARRLQR